MSSCRASSPLSSCRLAEPEWPQRRQCDYQRRRPAARATSAARPISRFLLFPPSVSRAPPTACRAGASPLFYSPCWMVVEYCAGEVKSELPACPMLSDLLYDVHQQPRFGWRVTLAPLLAQYWQTCDPARRTPRWLRWHQRLRRRGEPVLCGWRRCIWTSMPAILSTASPA